MGSGFSAPCLSAVAAKRRTKGELLDSALSVAAGARYERVMLSDWNGAAHWVCNEVKG